MAGFRRGGRRARTDHVCHRLERTWTRPLPARRSEPANGGSGGSNGSNGSHAPSASHAPAVAAHAFARSQAPAAPALMRATPPPAALRRAGQDGPAAPVPPEVRRRIELLERRIGKLVKALDSQDRELRVLIERRAKGFDLGQPSMYESVQGLAPDDPAFEAKRFLMQRIFESNLELKQLTSGNGNAHG